MLGKCFLVLCSVSLIFASLTGNLAGLSNAALDGAVKAVSLVISLVGIMSLWCGIMRVICDAGGMRALSRILSPVLRHVFPDAWKRGIGKDEITAAISANILGIGNAATPFAIKAMEKMQAGRHDADTERATDDMVTLAVLGSSSLDILPTTLIALRRNAGSEFPYRIIVPVWICSLICAVCAVLLSRLWSSASRKKTDGGDTS